MPRLLVAAVCVCMTLTSGAQAQDWPVRPVNLVVPFAAGGPTDTVARLVAESMSKDLGQQIIVENVGGAGGTLGAGRVASSDPDGYTVLLHHIGMATSATLYRKLAYDTLNVFEYVGLVTEVPMTILSRKNLETTDLKGLIEYAKANKDKVTVANAGIGAASHLCGMLFMSAIETPLVTVPYKGTGPAMTDQLGGQVEHVRLCTAPAVEELVDVQDPHAASPIGRAAVPTPAAERGQRSGRRAWGALRRARSPGFRGVPRPARDSRGEPDRGRGRLTPTSKTTRRTSVGPPATRPPP